MDATLLLTGKNAGYGHFEDGKRGWEGGGVGVNVQSAPSQFRFRLKVALELLKYYYVRFGRVTTTCRKTQRLVGPHKVDR
jgi:hypothetical protein